MDQGRHKKLKMPSGWYRYEDFTFPSLSESLLAHTKQKIPHARKLAPKHASTQARRHAITQSCRHTRTRACGQASTQAQCHMPARSHASTHAHENKHTRTYTHTHKHTHTNTHTHKHTHTHTHHCVSNLVCALAEPALGLNFLLWLAVSAL